jgi:Flp pilus assembly pilin Flp
MQAVLTALNRLVGEDEGQDLVEYGLLVVLLAVVAIAGITYLGNAVNVVLWQPIGTAF